MRRPLVIISVPYLRVARTLLSERVLGALGGADCAVVSPFADDARFRAEYGRSGVEFLRAPQPESVPRLFRAIYAVSEIMRMGGFWRRYRNRGLAYHCSIAGIRFEDDGKDQRESAFWSFVRRFASWLGNWPRSWRLTERLAGHRIFRFDAIRELASGYPAVTLLQASSWGFQDRLLAWHARRSGFRTVLVPYTTDQLWVNGYLLCDYDAVCVQGPFEERCARRYHEVAEPRIVQLGSMWFRIVDDFIREGGLSRARKDRKRRTILYAGVSPTYFPRRSEYAAVDSLLEALRSGRFGDARMVYRPYAVQASSRAEVGERYRNLPDVELQWPEEACAGLDGYSGDQITPQLLQYLRNLAVADVVIMSHTTSLGWDAAYMGCGVIANFADTTGVLARRRTDLRFSADGLLDCAPGLPVARSIEELLERVEEQLRFPDAAERSRAGVLSDWDYPRANTRALLSMAIYGTTSLPGGESVRVANTSA